MSPLPEQMADHWWWRPGCRPGRRQYVWHVLLDDQPGVRRAVQELQTRLAGLPGLDFVPEAWLHMTTHIVGFTDEISRAEVEEMTATAADRLRWPRPAAVTFGRVLLHPEAVMLAPEPVAALLPIYEAVRESAVKVLGRERADGNGVWAPHVTAAYSNMERAAQPVIRAAGKAVVTRDAIISQVHLVAQERLGHAYRWEPIAAADLGGHEQR